MIQPTYLPMKTSLAPILLAILPSLITVRAQEGSDPTIPSARLRAAMSTRTAAAIPPLLVKGVVVGSGQDGILLLSGPGGELVTARPGASFQVASGTSAVQLTLREIGPGGIVIENTATEESATLSGFGPIASAVESVPGGGDEIAYLEFREAPLAEVLRMVADQSGNNYSASMAAGKTPVSGFLRRVTADVAVEEICKSHNLWFKKDETSGVTRIMGVEEFEKDLVGFREEKVEVFTLLYPNVTDVTYAISDLFGDRVEIAFGNENLFEDSMDLQSRFDRFNVIGRGNLAASAFQGTGNGGGANGTINVFSQGGAFGFGGGFGGGLGMQGGFGNAGFGGFPGGSRVNGQDDALPEGSEDPADRFEGLTPDQAERVSRALASGDPTGGADATALRKVAPAVFVSANRRSNTIMVRTADAKIMEDIRALIRRLDMPTPLVLLEVKVLKIELGDGFESMFDFQYSDGNNAVGFGESPIPRPAQGGGPVFGSGTQDSDMTFVIVNENFRARLQWLERERRVDSIASPLLLTANNEVSRLFLGEERPLVRNISSQTILTDNNAATTPNTQVEFRPVGTTLLITPNINSDRTVTLRLLQEQSFINRDGATIPVVTSSSGNADNVENIPVDVLASRSVSGTFVARDGMAVAVGGLIEDKDNAATEGVPVLGRIPVIGILARRQTKERLREEVVVMIKPHVLSTPADGEKISEEVLAGLSGTARARLFESGMIDPSTAAKIPAGEPVFSNADGTPARPVAIPVEQPKKPLWWAR